MILVVAVGWLAAIALALAIFAAIVRHNDRGSAPRAFEAEHAAGEHDVIRHQACSLCHDLDPPPSEVVVGRIRWDPAAGAIVRATGRPAGGLVYDPAPPDDSGDWIQVESGAGQLVWRRLSRRLAGAPVRAMTGDEVDEVAPSQLPADGDELDLRARWGDR